MPSSVSPMSLMMDVGTRGQESPDMVLDMVVLHELN
jgi:hypothetical protein